MKRIILILSMLIAICFISYRMYISFVIADDNSEDTVNSEINIENKFCYSLKTKENDIYQVKFTKDKHGAIYGQIDIEIYEKDSKKGKFIGKLNSGNIAIAESYFYQERKLNKEDLAFIINEGSIQLASYNINMDTGRAYIDKNNLKFDDVKIASTSCDMKLSFKDYNFEINEENDGEFNIVSILANKGDIAFDELKFEINGRIANFYTLDINNNSFPEIYIISSNKNGVNNVIYGYEFLAIPEKSNNSNHFKIRKILWDDSFINKLKGYYGNDFVLDYGENMLVHVYPYFENEGQINDKSSAFIGIGTGNIAYKLEEVENELVLKPSGGYFILDNVNSELLFEANSFK